MLRNLVAYEIPYAVVTFILVISDVRLHFITIVTRVHIARRTVDETYTFEPEKIEPHIKPQPTQTRIRKTRMSQFYIRQMTRKNNNAIIIFYDNNAYYFVMYVYILQHTTHTRWT